MSEELLIRRATAADRDGIIELCRASLGWRQGDPNEGFFAWKHDRNPFGESPAWVAVAEGQTGQAGQIVGLRVFLRWEFAGGGAIGDGATGDGRISAVRAVDTATHPDWQGKGIFTKLTLAAVEELKGDGLDVVFNTPNDQSRPGYLKMGWQTVGRVPVGVQVRSVVSAARLRGAKAAAEKWSAGATAGVDAREVLADAEGLGALLDRLDPPAQIHTARSVEFLQWRYDFEPLGYRALPLGDSLADGVVLFRVRTRGTATELTVCDVLAPPGAKVRQGIRYLLRSAGADYAIVGTASLGATGRALGGATRGATLPGVPLAAGFVPVSKLGPILTWREVNRAGIPAIGDLSLTLGDIELF